MFVYGYLRCYGVEIQNDEGIQLKNGGWGTNSKPSQRNNLSHFILRMINIEDDYICNKYAEEVVVKFDKDRFCVTDSMVLKWLKGIK